MTYREVFPVFRKRGAIAAVAAGATVYFLPRSGIEAAIPSIDGITVPVVLLVAGFALVAMAPTEGDAGAAIEGVGFGLVALGVGAFGAK